MWIKVTRKAAKAGKKLEKHYNTNYLSAPSTKYNKMLNLLKDNIYSIVLNILFLLSLFSIFFPIEKLISKACKTRILKIHILLVSVLVILLVIAKVATLGFLINFLLITFSFFVFLFGLLSNRKYIYTLALVSLALTPVMLILKIEKLAEFLAQTCYLLLVLGIFKDIFYEKIFK